MTFTLPGTLVTLPGTLVASRLSDEQAHIRWDGALNDVYERVIEQSVNGGAWEFVGTLPVNNWMWVPTAPNRRTIYRVRVQGYEPLQSNPIHTTPAQLRNLRVTRTFTPHPLGMGVIWRFDCKRQIAGY